MAAAGKRPVIPPGTMFEYRLARLRFSQGYFVRRSIDVWPTGLEGNKLAELDCLALAFDPQLQRTLEVVECKTGAGGQGEIDRLVWLKGMGAFANARIVTFAKTQVAQRTRDFARQLNVQVIDDASIAAAEIALEIDPNWWPGFHDPDFGESYVAPARAALNSSQELRRVGKYLFGSFWFTDDFTRIKQLQTFFRLLVQHRSTLTLPALSLGVGEATSLFTLTVLSIASWRNQLSDQDFRSLVEPELSTGFGDPRSLRNLLRQIDELHRDEIEAVHRAYQLGGSGRLVVPLRSLETDLLTTPEWIDGLLNVVNRFARRAHLAGDVMRWVDLWASDLMGAPHGILMGGHEGLRNLTRDESQLQSAVDLVIAFLTRQWGVPKDLFSPPTFSINRTNGSVAQPNAHETSLPSSTTQDSNAVQKELNSPSRISEPDTQIRSDPDQNQTQDDGK